jgi:hypothetical protein
MAGGTFIQVNKYGPFGIADATGLYTYYPDLYSAVLAALPGQVVEAFADFVETTNEVTLADEVDINLNGHTYTFDSAGSGSAFTNASSVTGSCKIYNGKIIRTNAASSGDGHATIKVDNIPFNIEFYGVTLINTVGFVISDTNLANSSFTGNYVVKCVAAAPVAAIYNLNSVSTFIGATVTSDGPCILGPASSSVSFSECYLVSTGGGAITQNGDVTAYNTRIISLAGVSVQAFTFNLENCNIATSGFSSVTGQGLVKSCSIFSQGATAISFTGTSSQSTAVINSRINGFLGGCLSYSHSNSIHQITGNVMFSFNSGTISVISTGSALIYLFNNEIITSSNSGGNSIAATLTGTGTIEICNNKIIHAVSSLTAYAIQSGVGSLSVYITGNNITTANSVLYGPNVIQGQVNTIDNFGNIRKG